jgi:acyl-CoA synthetase (AMP-forming)/AMP-acid ligase II
MIHSHSRLDVSALRSKPPKPGAISGSTQAIALCASPTAIFGLSIVSRNAIRRRGENISSFEVEQVLLSHPAVANAAAFPVCSPLAEDEVMAAVILQPGQQLTEAQLIEFCEPRLPYFAVPRYLEFVRAADHRER